MGDLVVQQFVSADGFAANDQNEFDLFDSVEGDSAEFDQSNLEWLEGVGAIVLGAATYQMFVGYWPTPRARASWSPRRSTRCPSTSSPARSRRRPGGTTRPRPSNRVTLIGSETLGALLAVDYAVESAGH